MRTLFYNSPAAFYAFIAWLIVDLLAVASALVPGMAPPEEYNIDKLVHFFICAIGAYLPQHFLRNPYAYTCLVLLMILASGSVEYLQTFIPGRTASWGDLTANAAGLTALLIVYHLRRRRTP